MNPFFVFGGLLVAWAVVVAGLGLARPRFPGGALTGRLVLIVSVLLVGAAIASAVYGAGAESGI